MEVGSIRLNKTGFLTSRGGVNTTVWIHHMDAEKKKDLRELHKNATSYIEQILVSTPHETLAI